MWRSLTAVHTVVQPSATSDVSRTKVEWVDGHCWSTCVNVSQSLLKNQAIRDVTFGITSSDICNIWSFLGPAIFVSIYIEHSDTHLTFCTLNPTVNLNLQCDFCANNVLQLCVFYIKLFCLYYLQPYARAAFKSHSVCNSEPFGLCNLAKLIPNIR